jgi:hypothetical protein
VYKVRASHHKIKVLAKKKTGGRRIKKRELIQNHTLKASLLMCVFNRDLKIGTESESLISGRPFQSLRV